VGCFVVDIVGGVVEVIVDMNYISFEHRGVAVRYFKGRCKYLLIHLEAA
jgi:hypothetical protein